MTGRRGFGALQADVLAALWAAGRPLTAGELVTVLANPDLAYNTVQTVLARLYAKGVLRRRQTGRAHAYVPAFDEAGLAAQNMRAELDRGGDPTEVLLRFVDSLSDEEGRTLASLVDRFKANS